MVDFTAVNDVLLVDGHNQVEDDLRAALAGKLTADRRSSVAELQAGSARLVEAWYSDQHGFGHDCTLHRDVPREQWSPGCETFRAVTIATGVPAPPRIERARAQPVEDAAEVTVVRGGA